MKSMKYLMPFCDTKMMMGITSFIAVDIPNPDEHVWYVEMLKRRLQKSFRTHNYRFLFKEILRLMVYYLTMVAPWEMNFSPVKGGISKYLSPHVILGKNKISFNRYLEFSFENYVYLS